MKIKDDWEFDDLATGLKLKVIIGVKLDRLHLENIQGGKCSNRDFWFAKDGDFDGTGSSLSENSRDDIPDALPFEKELKILINKHSIENESNTPDWLLAQYLIGCLATFTTATQQRETYYGRDPRPTLPETK